MPTKEEEETSTKRSVSGGDNTATPAIETDDRNAGQREANSPESVTISKSDFKRSMNKEAKTARLEKLFRNWYLRRELAKV